MNHRCRHNSRTSSLVADNVTKSGCVLQPDQIEDGTFKKQKNLQEINHCSDGITRNDEFLTGGYFYILVGTILLSQLNNELMNLQKNTHIFRIGRTN